METWDAIRARRNVRVYTGQPIEGPALDRILEAGRRSPSSQNTQPWDFVVVTDQAQLQDLSKVWQGARHVANSAATVALVAPVRSEESQRGWVRYDLGQATMSMMLAAVDQGIGSARPGAGDQDLVRQLLGLPEGRFCASLIALGYPADRP